MLRATGFLAQHDYCWTFSLSGGVRCIFYYKDLSNEKTRRRHTLTVVTHVQSLLIIILLDHLLFSDRVLDLGNKFVNNIVITFATLLLSSKVPYLLAKIICLPINCVAG
jgi:hypothetical protein